MPPLQSSKRHLPYNPDLVARSRELRADPTPSEKKLWYEFLRQLPVRVHRQKILGSFIADFYIARAKLVIEVDGDSHFSEEGEVYDLMRSNFLETLGITVLRLTNQEVIQDFESVTMRITEFLADRDVQTQHPLILLRPPRRTSEGYTPSIERGKYKHTLPTSSQWAYNETARFSAIAYAMLYASKVLPILRSTRDMLLSNWGKADVIHQKNHQAISVVTQLDIDVEEFVSQQLKTLEPTIAFVGEEHGGDRTAERFWLMDPIDGTGHFIRGLPFCTSMLALISEGEVVFSAIYDFVHDHMYWAEKGQGAFRNTEKLQVGQRSLSDSYLAFEGQLQQTGDKDIFHRLREKTTTFKSVSGGWELAMIASGKLDGRICLNPYGSDYDFAPGVFLVSEAGGRVANLGSTTYDYRNVNFIAANPTIFEELTIGKEALFPLQI